MRSLQPVAPSASILVVAIRESSRRASTLVPVPALLVVCSVSCPESRLDPAGNSTVAWCVVSSSLSELMTCRAARRPATRPRPWQQSLRTATRSGRYSTDACPSGRNLRARTLHGGRRGVRPSGGRMFGGNRRCLCSMHAGCLRAMPSVARASSLELKGRRRQSLGPGSRACVPIFTLLAFRALDGESSARRFPWSR